MAWKIGTKVKVARNNDNDGYADFKDVVLRITHVAQNTIQHPGYDKAMRGMPLYDLETLDGEEISCSLYENELVRV